MEALTVANHESFATTLVFFLRSGCVGNVNDVSVRLLGRVAGLRSVRVTLAEGDEETGDEFLDRTILLLGCNKEDGGDLLGKVNHCFLLFRLDQSFIIIPLDVGEVTFGDLSSTR